MSPKSLHQFKSFQNRLIKYRSKKHTTNQAIAQVVSKNEAILLLNEVLNSKDLDPVKTREIYARIMALGKKRVPTMSPFNPPKGFYIWSAVDHGALHLKLLGRNVKETVLNLAHFVLQNIYNVERLQHKYVFILVKKKMPVGQLFFAKAGPHRSECLIAKIGKEKLLFHFENEGLFIHITLHCPHEIKISLSPIFQQLERDFATLCCPLLPSAN